MSRRFALAVQAGSASGLHDTLCSMAESRSVDPRELTEILDRLERLRADLKRIPITRQQAGSAANDDPEVSIEKPTAEE